MYLFIFIIIVFAAIAFVMFRKPNERQNSNSAGAQQQPMHFDLLDDKGNTIKPTISRVPSGSPACSADAPVQKLQYFCIKDKGYHVTVWPKDNRIGEVLEFTIAGMSYRDDIDDYLGEHVGTLEAEPTNEYDHNAIKILTEDGHHVGYVPKDITSEVRKSTTLPCTCYFYIGENAGTYFSDCYIKL